MVIVGRMELQLTRPRCESPRVILKLKRTRIVYRVSTSLIAWRSVVMISQIESPNDSTPNAPPLFRCPLGFEMLPCITGRVDVNSIHLVGYKTIPRMSGNILQRE